MDIAYTVISAKDQLLPKNEATRNGKKSSNHGVQQHHNVILYCSCHKKADMFLFVMSHDALEVV